MEPSGWMALLVAATRQYQHACARGPGRIGQVDVECGLGGIEFGFATFDHAGCVGVDVDARYVIANRPCTQTEATRWRTCGSARGLGGRSCSDEAAKQCGNRQSGEDQHPVPLVTSPWRG